MKREIYFVTLAAAVSSLSSLSRYFYLESGAFGAAQLKKFKVCSAAKAKNWNKRSRFETIQLPQIPHFQQQKK